MQPHATPPRLQFHASPQSQVARLRRWFWPAVLVPLLLTLPTLGPKPAWLISAATSLLVAALFHWSLTRQLRPGQPIVTVDEHGIASPQFRAPGRYRWDEVEQAKAITAQGYPVLQLRLRPSPERPDKPAFLSGYNPARPTVGLNVLAPEGQLQLLAAVQQRLAQQRGEPPAAAASSNELQAAHHFEAELKARTPVPWATHGLAALNIAAWGITLSLGADPVNPLPAQLLAWGGNAASEVQRGEWWRLLTATFLHGGVLHLLLNLVGLWAIGSTVERLFGHRLFVLVYLASALVGSVFSLHFAAQRAVSVGASGAVFGLAGALLTVVIRHHKALPPLFGKRNRNSMALFILYSLVQGATKPGIDNAAHVGGLLAGAALAWTLPERLSADSARKPVGKPLVMGATAALLACWLGIATAPPARLDLRQRFADEAHFVEGMRQLDVVIQAVQQEQRSLRAGRTTLAQVERRSREVHAPATRRALAELQQARLPDDDPRTPVLAPARRLAELTAQRLDLPPNPDPARIREQDAELKHAAEALNTAAARYKKTGPDKR